MSILRIKLFGNVYIERDGQELTNLPLKSQELLCYLLLYRNQIHARESLTNLLWPDHPFEQGKKHLRQSLWKLQTA